MIDLTLNHVWQVPSEIDNIEFFISKSGLFDKYIMPELRKSRSKEQVPDG